MEADETKRVLVAIAVDFSQHAEFAVQWYIDQFHLPHNDVILLHVPELFNEHMMSPQLLVDMAEKYNYKVEKMKEKMTEKFKQIGISAKFLQLYGKPGEAIVEFLKHSGVTVIVTGCRGQSTIRRTIMGSVSDFILHHAHVPVLVCRHKEFHDI